MRQTSIHRHVGEEPPDLGTLVDLATQEGHPFVLRTVTEWIDGTNRFDLPGEGFFLAVDDATPVGVCGLNVDPFIGDATVGRLRHLYVAPTHRGKGVARRLVESCLELAAGRFRLVRLRTFDPVADRFYRAIGFETVNEPRATHSVSL